MPEVTAGNVTIAWTDTFDDWARRAAGLPAVGANVLEAVIADLRSDAASRWPVDTGRSRDGLFAGLGLTSGVVTAFVSNEVPYAQFVQIGNRNAFDELVIAPGEERIPGIARLLADAILDELDG